MTEQPKVEEPKVDVQGKEEEVGELTAEARQILANLRAASRDCVQEIGQLEVRKAQVLANIDGLNKQAQGVLNSEAKRLGIPDGHRFQVTPEGKVIVLRPPQPATQQGPQLAPVEELKPKE
jgi:hypothetical protein